MKVNVFSDNPRDWVGGRTFSDEPDGKARIHAGDQADRKEFYREEWKKSFPKTETLLKPKRLQKKRTRPCPELLSISRVNIHIGGGTLDAAY